MITVLLGSGGHAAAVAALIEGEVRVFRYEEFFAAPPPGGVEVIVAIGDNALREKVFLRAVAEGYRLGICIAETAFVAANAVIGAGTVVGAGAVIGARATLGQNAIVNTLSSVDHDCVVGNHTQITAGVTIGGAVRIGQRCFFGVKSAVIPNVTIGDEAEIMAGALVVSNVPAGAMVGGSPARILRQRRPSSPD